MADIETIWQEVMCFAEAGRLNCPPATRWGADVVWSQMPFLQGDCWNDATCWPYEDWQVCEGSQ